MEPAAKRVLTEGQRVSSSRPDLASNPSTSESEDITARLRLLGARVRKTVTEGYAVPPQSTRTFTKANSTGHIFRSANDTLRDVYSTGRSANSVSISPRKRNREGADQGEGSASDVESEVDEDGQIGEMQLDTRPYDTNNASSGPFLGMGNGRPMRPLRKPRRMIAKTMSLPADSFKFSSSTADHDDVAMSPSDTEDDWSRSANTQPSFSLMTL